VSLAALVAGISIAVVPATVHRGHIVQVLGSAGDCPAGDSVTLLSHAFPATHQFAGVPAVYARVVRGGRFATTTRVPSTKAPGRYVITGRCGGGNLGVEAHLTVRR
jgi:hypothetical protein